MTIRVLLFAQLAETIGTRSIEIDLATGATVADALRAIESRCPVAAAMNGRLAVAVDERYARMDTVIREGQTIALVPPVSGG